MALRFAAVIEDKAMRRLATAVVLSLAVHGGLVFLVRTQPAAVSPARAPVIDARIERAGSQSDAAGQRATLTAGGETRREPLTAAEPAAAVETAAAVAAGPTPRLATARPADEQPGVTIALIRDPTYHPMAALDTPPRLLGDGDVCFPHGASGDVAYLLLIDEAGTVDQASIVAIQPEGLFTAAAVEMCSKLKFSPAIKNGRAVRSRVRFVVGKG